MNATLPTPQMGHLQSSGSAPISPSYSNPQTGQTYFFTPSVGLANSGAYFPRMACVWILFEEVVA